MILSTLKRERVVDSCEFWHFYELLNDFIHHIHAYFAIHPRFMREMSLIVYVSNLVVGMKNCRHEKMIFFFYSLMYSTQNRVSKDIYIFFMIYTCTNIEDWIDCILGWHVMIKKIWLQFFLLRIGCESHLQRSGRKWMMLQFNFSSCFMSQTPSDMIQCSIFL